MGPHTTIAGAVPEEEEGEQTQSQWRMAWDDVSGQELDPSEVSKARAKEMEYINKKGVWRLVPRAVAKLNGWKVIPTRWIDINKGDIATPNFRSRLVAKEFNIGEQDGLFAATPPLEAVRMLVSDAATTVRGRHCPEKVVMINDVARAFFEAPMKRWVCVELPAEARQGTEQPGEYVGLLQLSLYGTRDAAANFQEEVRRFMASLGFAQSKYNPQVYWHERRNLKTLVHGDDFMTSGPRSSAHWLRDQLGKRFEIKTKIIGRDEGEVAEERILGRILRVTEKGWEYEADPRHAELIVRSLGLGCANGVKSPGEEDRPWKEEENSEPLQSAEASAYRALAARANYLAQDRADIQYAAKEICRGMSAPSVGHMRAMRRLGRFLVAVPRVVWRFAFQAPVRVMTVYSDSDWAGCRRTARSTSGGVAMLGAHCIRTYSVTQKNVTLSSGEAELMALVRAASEAIGLTQLAASWGVQLEASVFVDSSAALAVTNRRGCGKLRHVRVGHLWVQGLAEQELVNFVKVRGTENPADLLTKHLLSSQRERLTDMLAQTPRAGQADSRIQLNALHLRGDPAHGGYMRGSRRSVETDSSLHACGSH